MQQIRCECEHIMFIATFVLITTPKSRHKFVRQLISGTISFDCEYHCYQLIIQLLSYIYPCLPVFAFLSYAVEVLINLNVLYKIKGEQLNRSFAKCLWIGKWYNYYLRNSLIHFRLMFYYPRWFYDTNIDLGLEQNLVHSWIQIRLQS